MPVRATVRRSSYQDSMVLMGVAVELRALPGVREAAALMGTPANHELLASAGLATPETRAAAARRPGARRGRRDRRRRRGRARGRPSALRRAPARARDRRAGRCRARSSRALRQLPGANLATISVPGAYAKLEALTALRRGLHVFLFSDNVPLADEIELKRLAVAAPAPLHGAGLRHRVPRRGRPRLRERRAPRPRSAASPPRAPGCRRWPRAWPRSVRGSRTASASAAATSRPRWVA